MMIKSLSFSCCLLLIAFLLPPAELRAQDDVAKTPGHMSLSRDEILGRGPGPGQAAVTGLPQTTGSRADVVELFQQVDEALVLKYLEGLVSFGPRVTSTKACQDSAQYIHDEFKSMGLDTKFHSWNYSGYWGDNVEATIYDSQGTSNEIFIICAHYDSVPGSPGADDNGSGVAAAMAIADILNDYTWDVDLRFVAFSGEEQGLLGSHEYAKDAYNNGDNIVAALNADMIGYALNASHESQIKSYNDTQSAWITSFADNIAQKYINEIGLDVIPSGYSWGSDHTSFNTYGYAANFFHEYKFNDYYHSSGDTIQHMNIPYLARCTKLVMATFAELAGAFEPLALTADDYTLSWRDGGVVDFDIDGEAANANRNYILMAGVSGTSPGFLLPGGYVTMPINWDAFTSVVLANMNTPLFDDFLGVLDGSGQGAAKLDTFGPFSSSLTGAHMYFAFACDKPWDYASNPVAVEIVD